MARDDILIQLYDDAVTYLGRAKKMSNDDKLTAYGLFKQVNVGNVNTSRPSFFDPVGQAKWDAWNTHKGTSTEEAKRKYVELALKAGFDPEAPQEGPGEGGEGSGGGGMGFGVTVGGMDIDDGTKKNFESGEEVFEAASKGDLDTLQQLLDANPSLINSIDGESGQCPLHWAADRGKEEIVSFLLSCAKVDVNLADSDGLTPLHYAVLCDHVDIARTLLSAGADVLKEDSDGETALSSASSAEMRQLLTEG